MKISHSTFTIFILSFLPSWSFANSIENCACDPARDRAALVALYNSTNGLNWANTWNLNDPMGSWYNVELNGEGCVNQLILRNNNLVGNLPTEIGDLCQITSLDLAENTLSGNIPTSITNLTDLFYLALTNNQLEGGIPADIGNLTQLENFRIGNNPQLGGTLPASMANMVALEQIALYGCGLMGTIPTDWDNLNNLQEIGFESNNLTGTLPNWITTRPQLTLLNFTANDLSGSIPATINNLTTLRYLNLGGNEFTGPMPSDLTGLLALEELDFGGIYNNFDPGDIPDISNSPNLKSIDLSNTQRTGNIPNWIGTRPSLEVIDLANNELSGNIPTNWTNFPNLRLLFLQNNNLTGGIPDMGTLPSLQELEMQSNQLDGTISNSIGTAPNLWFLDLCCQNLNGEIPANFSNLTSLQWFILNDNQLTGNIPDVSSMNSLRHLDLAYNSLTGEIPAGIVNLNQLYWLRLTNNQLEGEIPAQIGQLGLLETLGLSLNQLTGDIPASITNLVLLEELDLSYNNLTGNIPLNIGDMDALNILTLQANQLDGEIPTSIGQLEGLTILILGQNRLNGQIPTEIGDLSSLTNLALYDNLLEDEIPASIWSLPNLEHLLLSNNQLSGMLPPTLNPPSILKDLWLHYNNLNGSLPDNIVLNHLVNLTLGNNQFSGTLNIDNWNLGEIRLLDLGGNQLEGIIPTNLVNYTHLTDLYLNNNQFIGCIPNEFFTEFCGSVNVNLSNNVGISGGGNFEDFCNGLSGACQENYDCIDAIDIPLNPDPCGRDYVVANVTSATTSVGVPISDCEDTFSGNDVWFKVEVPSTGSFLIKNDSISSINTVAAFYTGDCGNLSPIACTEMDVFPHVLAMHDRVEGEVIYIRIWDKNNAVVGLGNAALTGLTGHILPEDRSEWELCDFPIELLHDDLSVGAGNLRANQFMIQYTPDADMMDIAEVEGELAAQQAVLVRECPCREQPLQLWEAPNPIEMEDTRRSSIQKPKVDTSNFNYLLEQRTFQSNSYTAGQQGFSSVAIDANGQFITIWQDNARDGDRSGVFGQLFDAAGSFLENDFQVNTDALFHQDRPSIAMAADGRFVATWSNGLHTREIIAQVFDAQANKVGGEIRVTSPQLGYNPSIAMDANANFVVTWEMSDGNGLGVFQQRYSAAGSALGDITPLHNLNFGNQQLVDIAMNEAGNYVTIWQSSSHEQPHSGWGLLGNTYNAQGEITSVNLFDFQINTTTTNNQQFPAVAINASGKFVAVWESYDLDTENGRIMAQRFHENGEKDGPEITVYTLANHPQTRPDVVMYDDGGFFVIWESFQGGTSTDIWGQLFAPDGIAIGMPIVVNDILTDAQRRPTMDMNANGQIIVSWESYGQDGSGQGIFGQLYETAGTGASRTLNALNTTLLAGLGKLKPYSPNIYNPSNPQQSVKVAVMDTGLDFDHNRLSNALWMNDAQSCLPNALFGYDFTSGENGGVYGDPEPEDNDGHGTSVNGMIVEDFPNDIQLELMNIKFYENNQGSLFDAVCGIYFAVDEGAKVMNLSWGFESSQYPTILADALNYAAANDVLIITSAGNTSKNNDDIQKYPANLNIPNMIVVTAYHEEQLEDRKRLANYASYGVNRVDLAAAGYVETTGLANGMTTTAGTSLAAPAVARTAAIIRATYPNLNAGQVKSCILQSVDIVEGLPVATEGILNHDAALACAADPPLAVEALLLRGTVQETSNLLECWVEASKETEEFYLERSFDGRNFSTLRTFTVEDISIDQTFAYQDTKPYPSSYYRLVSNEKSGNRSRSDIILLERSDVDNIYIYGLMPNPAKDRTLLTLELSNSNEVQLEAINVTGQVIFQKAFFTEKGVQQIEINTSNWSNGSYWVKVSGSNFQPVVLKLVVVDF